MLSRLHEARAKRLRGEQGFTLIELLVVVVILGILIAIAVPVYLNYQNNAKKKSLESDVRAAISSVEQCIADNGGAFGTECVATFDEDNAGSDEYLVNTSDGNELVVAADGDHDGGYTITGNRSDPTYTVTYTSGNGDFAKS